MNDAISASSQAGDIEDQGTFYDPQNQIKTDNNYLYTAIGELQVDKSEDIEEIVWRVDSKIAEVRRTNNSTKKNLRFDYDAMGNRIAKHIYTDNQFTDWEKSTYYVRDASGNVMAVYDREATGQVPPSSFHVSERHIYGSSRIGMDVTTYEFISTTYTATDETTRELGHKQYEISNHLGNVLSVITDQKLPEEAAGVIVSYSAVIITATDYSPFGVGLYGRSWSEGYRYGFNGKEVDSEGMGGGSSTYDYGFRIYNAQLGKFLSVDPLYQSFAGLSPFHYASNNPVTNVDLDGLEAVNATHESFILEVGVKLYVAYRAEMVAKNRESASTAHKEVWSIRGAAFALALAAYEAGYGNSDAYSTSKSANNYWGMGDAGATRIYYSSFEAGLNDFIHDLSSRWPNAVGLLESGDFNSDDMNSGLNSGPYHKYPAYNDDPDASQSSGFQDYAGMILNQVMPGVVARTIKVINQRVSKLSSGISVLKSENERLIVASQVRELTSEEWNTITANSNQIREMRLEVETLNSVSEELQTVY